MRAKEGLRPRAEARPVAAHLMEATPADVEFADGTFRIVGTDRAMPLMEVAKAFYDKTGTPSTFGVGLEARAHEAHDAARLRGVRKLKPSEAMAVAPRPHYGDLGRERVNGAPQRPADPSKEARGVGRFQQAGAQSCLAAPL